MIARVTVNPSPLKSCHSAAFAPAAAANPDVREGVRDDVVDGVLDGLREGVGVAVAVFVVDGEIPVLIV